MTEKKLAVTILLVAIVVAAIHYFSLEYSERSSDWITTTDERLGIQFEHPADATISPPKKRQTVDGATIDELIVIPIGVDATRVHFFTTTATFEDAKNIQIYEFAAIENSEFENAKFDEIVGVRRIDNYSNNDCTNELFVFPKNEIVYGFHVVACPTHPENYDQIRKEIAESLEIL